jgi:hypothetical protein
MLLILYIHVHGAKCFHATCGTGIPISFIPLYTRPKLTTVADTDFGFMVECLAFEGRAP